MPKVDVNLGGRPRFYKTAEDLAEACGAYFERCIEDQVGPTITGLALHLGYSRKEQLYQQRRDAAYTWVVDRARLMVEQGYEQVLRSGMNPAGAIFALKNMQWSDKQELDVKDDRALKEMTEGERTAKLKGLAETARRRMLDHIEVEVEVEPEEDWM